MTSFTPRLLRSSRALTTHPLRRRSYATASQPPQKNNTWMLISAALAIPAAYYLLAGGGTRNPGPNQPSYTDQPASRKASAGGNTMSAKQESLDNADTSHPYVNEPGKSVKGEGETDSAKVKGTVSPTRPQR
ncbi:hypothetical protein BJX61DRAFT_524931 [Aspergillus egyptiacus]|nr:hypothetical protein BJX61DRAFT_524931 [Aspergillus egyptiacus]